jgi:hypothetical protein
MQEYLPLILLFVFFVLPLIERVLKGGRQQPPEQGPPARRRPQVERQETPELQAPRGDGLLPERRPEPESSDAAADMIPDDLWEILTGERRTTRPAPPPAPVEAEPELWDGPGEADPAAWEFDDEATPEPYIDEVEVHERDRVHREHEAAAARTDALLTERERGAHTAERAPVRAAPRLKVFDVSQGQTAAERRAAFHRRIDVPTPPPAPRRAGRLGALAGLGAADMRRAIVLREVLGPPASLDPDRSL